ncbi:MAG: DUF4393 domain-containing protein [Sulfuritalea sp.]|nr:DUF4393 domain-containing protein [Sulfuritalea sp.]
MSDGWLQVVQEATKLPSLLVEIYGDLARPGVRQAGKALETILGLGNTILWPIAWANERTRIALDQNLEKYRVRMEAIPEERVVPIAPEIGVPIAEKLAYVRDERLSNLYVNLLAKASDSETIHQAHPSFVNVINNLSPDEALLLEKLRVSGSVPFMTARAESPQGSFYVLHSSVVSKDLESGLTFPKNISAYLSNLTGLGIINLLADQWIDNKEIYAEIESASTEHFLNLIQKKENSTERNLVFNKGIIETTHFGLQFMAACHAVES